MTDRPILFSAPMIRALLDGSKTQTRRVLVLPEKTASGGSHYVRPGMGGWEPAVHGGGGCFTFGKDGQRVPVPEMVGLYHGTCGTSIVTPIQRGDRLWVKEALERSTGEAVGYPADGTWLPNTPWDWKRKNLSGRFMPRWASRLTLYVTDVRVQRLQDVSEEDAIAEGITRRRDGGFAVIDHLRGLTGSAPDAGTAFRALWDVINGPDAWEANPWVAAYTFEVRRGNIDSLPVEIGEAA